MKSVVRLLYGFVLLVLTLTACGPQTQPTAAPTNPPVLTQVPEATATEVLPQIQPVSVDLSGPKPGTQMLWVDGGTLVYVSSDPFTMGAGGADNPEHTVTLSPFWIYRTKVTNRMYRLCVLVGVCSPPQTQQAADELLDKYLRDRPVVDVTWQQAQTYCTWVQGSLPTEAQWELAAVGPDSLIYPWGDAQPSCDLLNFNNCLGKTSRVLDYLNGASPFGALDMAGNAFEWVADWYDADYYPNGPDENPPGPRVGTERVVRSSSFGSQPTDIPSALRLHRDPNKSRADLGFRCVVEKPHVFAPYCQTSAMVPGDSGETPSSSGCGDVGEREISRDCTFTMHEVTGGVVRAARGMPPLTGCELFTDSRIGCSGPSGVTGTVTAMVTCGTVGRGSHLADPECLRGYTPVPGSEVTCEIVTGGDSGESERVEPRLEIEEDGCPDGMRPIHRADGSTHCVGEVGEIETGDEPREEDTDGCPGPLVPGTAADGTPICHATAPDGTEVGCPRGTFPIESGSVGGTSSGYSCIGRAVGSGPGACPPGTYLHDSGRFCIGPALTGDAAIPSNPCLEGFTYDSTLGCCMAPTEDAYPGCSSDEYYDTVHGCRLRPDESGASITIISFSASTRVCGGSDGGNDGGNNCGGLDKNSCYGTPGCSWDDMTSTCS